MSVGFLVAALVALVGVPAGFLGYKAVQESKRSAEVFAGAPDAYAGFEGREAHAEYLRWVLDRAHPVAFDHAYSSGGLFKPAEFDELEYRIVLGEEMVRIMREAPEQERRGVADELERYFNKGHAPRR